MNAHKIKSFIIDAIIALVSVLYVAMSLLVLKRTDVNPLDLLLEASLGIIIGLLIKTLCVKKGLVKGHESDIWIDELAKYNQSCNTVTEYIDRANNFKLCEKIEITKEYRVEVLTRNRMKYSMWFNTKGEYEPTCRIVSPSKLKKMMEKKKNIDGYVALSLRQRLILKKCINIKVKPLDIFSEYNTDIEKTALQGEQTDKSFERQSALKNALTAILIALLGVYFFPDLKQGFSWSETIYSSVQVAIWLSFGIIQMYNAIDFVRKTKVNILRKKKELIQKFKKGCEAGLYKTNPYDNKEVVEA